MTVGTRSSWTPRTFTSSPTPRPLAAPRRPIQSAEQLLEAVEADRIVYSPVMARTAGTFAWRSSGSAPHLKLYRRHNTIDFHAEGHGDICLPRGATAATLQGPLSLQPGDVLIFEEILGPHTGQETDADPSRRYAVRLTRVAADAKSKLVEVEWFEDDALPFPLCLRSSTAIGKVISVAHGNVILVDQGLWQKPESLKPVRWSDTAEGPDTGRATRSDGRRGAWRFEPLSKRSLTHAAAFPDPQVVAQVQAGYLAELHERLSPTTDAALSRRVKLLLDLVLMGVPLLGWDVALELRLSLRLVSLPGIDPHPLLPWLGPPPQARADRLADTSPLHPLSYGPASTALAQRPQEAVPALWLKSDWPPRRWTPRRDLLQPGKELPVVAEIDDGGAAHLRFDDDTPGSAPCPAKRSRPVTASATARPATSAPNRLPAAAPSTNRSRASRRCATRCPPRAGPTRRSSRRSSCWRRARSAMSRCGRSSPPTTPSWPAATGACRRRRRKRAGPAPASRSM